MTMGLDFPLWLELALSAMLLISSFFILVGTIGMIRLPDFFMRLHAPTKSSTLGVGGVLVVAIVMGWAMGRPSIAELLITLFVFMTAPVSANLMSQAALHLNAHSKAPVPPHLSKK